MIKDLISVVIPYYKSDFIEQSLNTIFSQTYKNIEVIIIDDCSPESDKLVEIIKNFDIKVYGRNDENLKQTKTRNIGAQYAEGEFLLFSDADVMWLPFAFEEHIKTLKENPDCAWSYSNFIWGNLFMNFYEFSEYWMYRHNCSSTMSMMRHAVYPGWDERLIKMEDWELFIHIMENGHKGKWINKILFQTPMSQTGVTKGTISEEEAKIALKEIWPKVVL